MLTTTKRLKCAAPYSACTPQDHVVFFFSKDIEAQRDSTLSGCCYFLLFRNQPPSNLATVNQCLHSSHCLWKVTKAGKQGQVLLEPANGSCDVKPSINGIQSGDQEKSFFCLKQASNRHWAQSCKRTCWFCFLDKM